MKLAELTLRQRDNRNACEFERFVEGSHISLVTADEIQSLCQYDVELACLMSPPDLRKQPVKITTSAPDDWTSRLNEDREMIVYDVRKVERYNDLKTGLYKRVRDVQKSYISFLEHLRKTGAL
ncbi:hypothetical protein JHE03_11670 [Pluralibacter gergoviae]|uniref:hypothetical protein n=1 Tax=Pluralibacter gergoviae TaxID=61647 RepID=UPI00190AF118|nr:hypothetical protein [Pluralibacter gergoviae]ELC3074268.1 hypothetical protein [Pluralibacter gergoviae]MBK4116954.1 hypothetical protein [Pluralibacter gergoviae]